LLVAVEEEQHHLLVQAVVEVAQVDLGQAYLH
jgi:hypothetical protein